MMQELQRFDDRLRHFLTKGKEGIPRGNDPKLLLTGNGQRGIYREKLFKDVLLQRGLPSHNLGVLHFTHSTTTRQQTTKRTPVQIVVENFAAETKKRGFTPDIGIHLFAEGEFETVARTTQSLKEIKNSYPDIPHLIINLPPFKNTDSLVAKDRQTWSPQALAEELDILYLELNPTLSEEQEGTFLTGLARFLRKKSSIALLQQLQQQSRFIGAGMNSQEFFTTHSPGAIGSDFERLDFAATNAVGIALSEEGRIGTYTRKDDNVTSQDDAPLRDIIILQTPSVAAPAAKPGELLLGLLPPGYTDPKRAHFVPHIENELLVKSKDVPGISTGTATAITLYPATA